MKNSVFVWLPVIAITTLSALGQGFVDLNFEAATNLPPPLGSVAVTNALPGWMAFSGTNQLTTIPYNPVASAIATLWLLGSNSDVPSGYFAVMLGSGYSISQTGMIPTNSESLLFDVMAGGSPPFVVSLGSQNLSYEAISNALNFYGRSYTVYSADISAFAGHVATLTFSAVGGGILDDIRFSSTPVPEPGGVALMALGSGVVIYVSRRKHR